MADQPTPFSRRKFLAAALTAGALPAAAAATPAAFRSQPPPAAGRKPVAVVATVYRPAAYAPCLTERFLLGYHRAGYFHLPSYFVRSLYVDQTPDNDQSRAVAREFNVAVTRRLPEALTYQGRLAVDGVLLLAEHGNYPRNERGQILYPRYELFEQIVQVFRETGQRVPVFCAKHLSYRHDRALQMAAWARELDFPLMAGSLVPLTWRRPELELPAGAAVREALVVAHGPLEVAGFDALEALQAMVERRHGGETGVQAVTCLTGKAVWQAGDEGRWSWSLLDAALARSETASLGDPRRTVGKVAVGSMPAAPATAFLVEYRDGLRGTVLLLNGHLQDFCFAAHVAGTTQPVSCLFYQPGAPGLRTFDRLAAAVEDFFDGSRTPYPLERTLLTTGVLEAFMESHARRGARVETSELVVRYRG